jgi:hypothetical protein
MGGESAQLTPEESARHLRATIAALPESANGSFLNYDGTPIPW